MATRSGRSGAKTLSIGLTPEDAADLDELVALLPPVTSRVIARMAFRCGMDQMLRDHALAGGQLAPERPVSEQPEPRVPVDAAAPVLAAVESGPTHAPVAAAYLDVDTAVDISRVDRHK